MVISRTLWLLAAAGTLAVGLAAACGGDHDGGSARCPGASACTGGAAGASGADGGAEAAGASGADGGGAQAIFDVWRDARQALRQSPDHLIGQADALVAAKDPAKLFEFVRDQIVTYPPSDDSMYGMASAMRWGVRATLRGGAGTPREKAELLRELYERAGLEAEVVAGPLDPAKADGQAILLRAVARTFAPSADAPTRQSWLDTLKKSAPAHGSALDPDLTETQVLAASIGALVTSAAGGFDFTVADIPLVRVMVGGAWKYASPVVPGAAFGDSTTTAEPGPAGAPDAPPQIEVTVEGSRSDAPYDRFPLISATYDADQVAGRRINLQFSPGVAHDSLPQTRFDDVQSFIPVLSVSGADVTDAERDLLAHLGPSVTLGGDVIDVAPNGDVTVGGVPLGQGASDAAALARAQSLTLGVRGDAFRRIDLRVAALDAGGKNVAGLRADAFRVLEDGQPVAATLTQNPAGPPRILLIADTSASLPPEYLGAGAADFGTQVIMPLYAAFPNAEVRVATINFGVSFAPGGWATSLADAQAEVAWLASQAGGSEIYQAAADAETEQPTAIIMYTDGVPTDALTPEFSAKLAGGAPVLGIGIGAAPAMQSLQAIAKLSGGLATTAADKSAAIAAANGFIAARALDDYLISYRAPQAGAATRQVKVELDGGRVTATGSYDVPATPAPVRALSSIVLTLRVGDRETTRTLAGFERSFTTAYTEIPQAALDDVRALLFGRVTFEVEGAGVTPSEWLDDWLGERLTLEPAYDALLANDDAAIQAAAKRGFDLTPAKLFAMSAPLPGAAAADALTFEHGPRVAALVQKVRFGEGLERQMDVFSNGVWHTAAADPSAAFRRSLARTAYVASAEASLYPVSTRSLLASTPLAAFVPGSVQSLPELDPEASRRWSVLEAPFSPAEYSLVAPAAGAPFAFWAVHTPSGSLIGVMPDGSGGAIEEEANANLDATNHVLDLIGDIGTLAGADVGFWVKLEQTKAAKLTAATIIIAGGQASIGDWAGDLGSGLCDAASDGLSGAIPGLDAYANLQEAVSQGSFWSGLGEVNLPDVTSGICP
ncbi:MAG: VWA domain-containing protein [Polyangiaceae bacterium]|nr:VWA domain-containing protein [Polyangiaceae bacterium]